MHDLPPFFAIQNHISFKMQKMTRNNIYLFELMMEFSPRVAFLQWFLKVPSVSPSFLAHFIRRNINNSIDFVSFLCYNEVYAVERARFQSFVRGYLTVIQKRKDYAFLYE